MVRLGLLQCSVVRLGGISRKQWAYEHERARSENRTSVLGLGDTLFAVLVTEFGIGVYVRSEHVFVGISLIYAVPSIGLLVDQSHVRHHSGHATGF
jgi:hypothetical protein